MLPVTILYVQAFQTTRDNNRSAALNGVMISGLVGWGTGSFLGIAGAFAKKFRLQTAGNLLLATSVAVLVRAPTMNPRECT